MCAPLPSRYGAEAERVADWMTRATLGSGVPIGGYTPCRGLAHALQRYAPAELEERPLGQWEAMLAAMPSGRLNV